MFNFKTECYILHNYERGWSCDFQKCNINTQNSSFHPGTYNLLKGSSMAVFCIIDYNSFFYFNYFKIIIAITLIGYLVKNFIPCLEACSEAIFFSTFGDSFVIF